MRSSIVVSMNGVLRQTADSSRRSGRTGVRSNTCTTLEHVFEPFKARAEQVFEPLSAWNATRRSNKCLNDAFPEDYVGFTTSAGMRGGAAHR